jgi:hypothetical protein
MYPSSDRTADSSVSQPLNATPLDNGLSPPTDGRATEPLQEKALDVTKALSVSHNADLRRTFMGDSEVLFKAPPEHVSLAFNGLREGGGCLNSSTSTTTPK